MARLYANENFPRQVVEALRELSHDVLTVQEAGKADKGIQDDEVLAFASDQERVLITLNRRDFIRLHMAHPEHAGIVVCTQDANTEDQARRIHHAVQSATDLVGSLIRVNRPQT